ncbi:MAG: hypothetical protein CML17_02330 [Pusillimonas sp.]|nr:hypothetical protein [Pusillimonas sp.]|tara:strand:+ start:4073 stop:4570 length:498 start_codon:yes stop_codon:yes gene_type:complete
MFWVLGFGLLGGVFRRWLGYGDNVSRWIKLVFGFVAAVVASFYLPVWVAPLMVLYWLPGHKFADEESTKNIISDLFVRYSAVPIGIAMLYAGMSEFGLFDWSQLPWLIAFSFAGVMCVVNYCIANVLYLRGVNVNIPFFDGTHSVAEFANGFVLFASIAFVTYVL